MSDLFNKIQISQLYRECSKIDRIDPLSPSYVGMIKLLDSMTQDQLRQVRDAKIKFLSRLALNRIKRATLNCPSMSRSETQ